MPHRPAQHLPSGSLRRALHRNDHALPAQRVLGDIEEYLEHLR